MRGGYGRIAEMGRGDRRGSMDIREDSKEGKVKDKTAEQSRGTHGKGKGKQAKRTKSNKNRKGSGGETITCCKTAKTDLLCRLSFSLRLSGSSVMAMFRKARRCKDSNSFAPAPKTHFRG